MAFPVVANSVTNNDTTGTSHSVGLPTGIAAGDLIIVIFASDGAPTVTWPSGWNQAANNLIATTLSTDVTLAAKQRVADGSEGGTNITVTTSVSEWAAWVTLRITGWHGTTAAEGATATGSSANPDPPNLDPANWATEDTLWIAGACKDCGGTDNDDITAHPGSYTGIGIALATTNAGGVTLSGARRDNAVSAENPGVVTAPTTEAWVAYTIAIRPTGVVAGTVALSVPQPSIAASGSVVSAITGTAAFTVPQPAIAAAGHLEYSGTVALAVAQPVLAATGTVTVTISGTAAFTVPQPSLAITGTVPVVAQPGGGGRSKRHTVHRYPPRRTRIADLDFAVNDLHSGTVAMGVPQPRLRVSGDVLSPAEQEAEARMMLDEIVDDEDFALALSLADTWL